MDKAVIMKPSDNVATCLCDLPIGEAQDIKVNANRMIVTPRQPIPFGHKIALIDIPSGANIVKYAEVIGIASSPIQAGDHVHIHNVESVRARGDISPGDQSGAVS